MRAYRALLERVDEWYLRCRAASPAKVPCGRGCRDCCLGLFDVSLLDRDLLREGMRGLDEASRADVLARSAAILDRLRADFPGLGEDLDGWSPEEVDDLCDALGPVECPVLGKEGECRLYGHRPLVCRLEGVPLVDVSGGTVHPEGCPRCSLGIDEAPRLDVEALRREERGILRRLHPGRGGVTLLVPQATARGG